ncbi:sensor histidine kinase [Isobaculum melis]|uniref:histidine kinase n=1 Tax=Isobaculum melis TaxID=142588 RepID=A0A1H9U586_9LACT|nr:sensor histidine kinase [Isobaculum melis]SES04233.1 Two-component sensor histidine kinase, contains HisKA and HATPase domains [Isobaculum melis]
MIKNQIAALCQKYSDLTDADIDEICFQAHKIEMSTMYAEQDVFIDIINIYTREAVVIYHKPPTKVASLYKETVVGKTAKRENEPGVLRTFETTLNSEGLLARNQEDKLIRQKVYPIRNNKRNIAVLIIEEDVSQTIKDSFEVSHKHQDFVEVSSALQAIESFNESIVDNLNDGILIFDKAGYLLQKNKAADLYYESFGYIGDILGLHYDNLSLDLSTFEQLAYLKTTGEWSNSHVKEVKFDSYYFAMKQIFVDQENVFIMMLQDKTEIKDKEAEIISKSVAIREIHHRVKNNLQSVVSLLRIQARRCESQEAKTVLNESVSRILAISATHELLSKQVEDGIQLKTVLESVVYNIQRCFSERQQITIMNDVSPEIVIDSDRTVAIALIVNELLQNSYDHAFENDQVGLIQLTAKKDEKVITISVIDNGTGFDVKKVATTSLGLQIVNSYVKDKLRGKIKIKSNREIGTSTCFSFKN